MTYIFYLLKYETKKHLRLACVQHTVHICVNADMYIYLWKFMCFQSKGTTYQWKLVAKRILGRRKSWWESFTQLQWKQDLTAWLKKVPSHVIRVNKKPELMGQSVYNKKKRKEKKKETKKENWWPKWSSHSECLCCSVLRPLHPEQLKGCWLRWSNFTNYSIRLQPNLSFPKDSNAPRQQEAVYRIQHPYSQVMG